MTDVRGLEAAARMAGELLTAASRIDKSDTPEATLAMVSGTRTLSMTWTMDSPAVTSAMVTFASLMETVVLQRRRRERYYQMVCWQMLHIWKMHKHLRSLRKS